MIDATIESWSAWTPGTPSRNQMSDWLTTKNADTGDLDGDSNPELDALDSRQLRRCSTITRMGLRAAFDCMDASRFEPDEVQLVWVTQHGEVGVTIDLLQDLANDEMLMPMSFSNSVPNTPAAYYDIASNNTLPTRTVCGGPDSFHQGLIEAVGLLDKNPDHPVLLVRADGVLPDPLEGFNDDYAVPFGVGLVLQRSDGNGDVTCRFEQARARESEIQYPPALCFLRWYLGSSDRTEIPIRTKKWIWERRE